MKSRYPLLTGIMAGQLFCATAHAEGPIDGKVYGKLNTSLLAQKKQGVSDTHLTYNNSYFGFKGKTPLEEGMSVIYQLEYQVAPDETAAANGTSGIFKQRNSYLGLSGAWGTLIAGSYNTPLRSVQGKIDQFNNLPVGDIKNLITGEVRVHDVILYTSPSLKNTQLKVASQSKEQGEGSDGISTSVTYKADKLYLAAGADKRIGKVGKEMDRARLGAQYSFDKLKVGAIASRSRNSTGNTEAKSGWLVSGAYKLNKVTLKAQFGRGDEKSKGRQLTDVGADYKLGAKTRLFTYYAAYKDDADSKASAYGVGLEHKF